MAASATLYPPPDPCGYKFDNFIADICEKITKKDLDKLKLRFKDIIYADVRTPRAMFDALVEKGYVDCYNILYIQQILRVLEKEDLLEIAAKYVKLFEEDDVLHFFQRTTKTAAGFDIVEFHVQGRLPSKEALEHFRRKISTILLVPLHEVIFKGVQETRSLLITVMLPKVYVDFLINQLRQNKQHIIASFLQLEVDQIIFSADTFQLREDSSVFIAKMISESAQNVQPEGKRKAAKGEQKQKSPSFQQTDVKTPHEQTLKSRKEELGSSTVPMSHTKQTLPSVMKVMVKCH